MHIHDAHRLALLVIRRRRDERKRQPCGKQQAGESGAPGRYGSGKAREARRIGEAVHGVFHRNIWTGSRPKESMAALLRRGSVAIQAARQEQHRSQRSTEQPAALARGGPRPLEIDR